MTEPSAFRPTEGTSLGRSAPGNLSSLCQRDTPALRMYTVCQRREVPAPHVKTDRDATKTVSQVSAGLEAGKRAVPKLVQSWIEPLTATGGSSINRSASTAV